MKKRAVSLSMNTIVIAALALLILVILILVFRTQITKTAKSYMDIGDKAAGEIDTSSKCQVNNRICAKSACPKTPKVYTKVPVYTMTWSDCGKGEICCAPVN
ncbi:hypothetical protein KY333_02620 [Candidatus Woesearchaeota archaeon]|nr:hypothetical protein [Candidatus Woesearchaeota archaeon]